MLTTTTAAKTGQIFLNVPTIIIISRSFNLFSGPISFHLCFDLCTTDKQYQHSTCSELMSSVIFDYGQYLEEPIFEPTSTWQRCDYQADVLTTRPCCPQTCLVHYCKHVRTFYIKKCRWRQMHQFGKEKMTWIILTFTLIHLINSFFWFIHAASVHHLMLNQGIVSSIHRVLLYSE